MHQCARGVIVAKCFLFFLQIQLKSSLGETILISAWVMVIRRADSPLSLWTCLPEMEFTLSRYARNTLWPCQLLQHWLTILFKKPIFNRLKLNTPGFFSVDSETGYSSEASPRQRFCITQHCLWGKSDMDWGGWGGNPHFKPWLTLTHSLSM